MNKSEAKNLILKTFEDSFDESRFTYFIKNLLNNIDDSESKKFEYHGQFVPASFRDSVKQYKRLGQYKDSDKNTIDVLVVNLKRESTLERARTLQRNFIAWYLKQKNREAALVAYFTDGYDDWRFSLVKMDFNLSAGASAKAGLNKTKVEIELSPAKRYSFLVGANERSHTAQTQFQKILTEIPNPTLNDLEQAFNIETVTREFFLEYRNLFIRTKQALDKVIENDPKVRAEFSAKGGSASGGDSKALNSVDFSKKLLGQIIFLYFLQKKGWFGVERDSDWGTGSKKFLRELLDRKHGDYNNFFNDILEPLFYEALRYDRQDYYYSRFNCKIPFLNGGLFDPINNYDWVHTDIILPNELFSNKNKTPQGDVGDGIFDVFDRYNFTVIEDEPLEKEVAIDPELLGKAYEKFNAIRPDNFDEYLKALKSGKKGEENKFNKQYGVYYTPREIVHYMCRESLINYLASELSDRVDAYQKISTEQLDAFGNTARKGQLALEAEYKPNPFIPKEDIETLINYGELLGENEAVVVRRLADKGKETETYYHKLPESIRKNAMLIDEKLADILICDPAVGSGAFPVGMMHEIVGTRNLLSIFIPVRRSDSEGGKEPGRTIYNFKRECIEKSLYGVDIDSGAVEIAKLRLWLSLVVDEDDFKEIKPLPNLDYKIVKGNSLLGFPDDWKSPISEIIENLKKEYFTETRPQNKAILKEEIENQIKSRLENSQKNFGYQIDFDFKTFFSEVFHHKKGFDCILGNPPWSAKINDEQKRLVAKRYELSSKNLNIFAPFILHSMKLINSIGVICLLIPKVFIKNSSYQTIREDIIKNYSLINLIDFGKFPNVASDCVTPMISNKKERKTSITLFKEEAIEKNLINQEIFGKNPVFAFSFNITEEKVKLLNTIENNTNKLSPNIAKIKRGIELGQKSLVALCSNCKIWNEVGEKYYNENEKVCKSCGYKLNSKEAICISNKSKSSEYTLACLSGKEIDYYKINEGYYIVNNLKGIDYKEDISKGDRIYIRRIATNPIGVYLNSKQDYLAFNTVYSIYNCKYDARLILGILNSNLMRFYYENVYNLGMNLTTQVTIEYLKELPIVKINLESVQNCYSAIINAVDNIQSLICSKNQTKSKIKSMKDQIDIMVYKLYNLTYEEVKIIDQEIDKIISKEDYDKN